MRSIAFELFKPNLKEIPNALIDKAQNDSFMPIRREILRAIWENSRDIDATYCFLFDKHASVRSLSVRFLEEAGEKDNVIDGYISELVSYNSIQKSGCAIWAIGHFALEEHHNHARTHLFSNYPSIRKQALLTLFKLRVSDIGSILKECLYDDSPSVRKLSLRLHKDLEISYSVNDLLSLAQNTTDHKYRETFFDVARLSNRWDRLIFLVLLFDQKYVDLFSNELIIKSIQDWVVDSNRVASSPDKNQTLHLRKLLNANPKILNLDKTMPFILKTYGIIDIS